VQANEKPVLDMIVSKAIAWPLGSEAIYENWIVLFMIKESIQENKKDCIIVYYLLGSILWTWHKKAYEILCKLVETKNLFLNIWIEKICLGIG
jgi:hypothetical protein